MTRGTGVFRADVKRIVRDPFLILLAIVPLAITAAARATGPWVAAQFAGSLDMVVYWEVALSILLLNTPLMLGFLYGMMLLDERDEGVLVAVALTPIGKSGFMIRRMLVPVIWSMATSLLVILIVPAATISNVLAAQLTLLLGLQAPLLGLFVAAFAANKVEGMALSKVGGVLIALGALAVLLATPWQWLAVWSPHFWFMRVLLGTGVSGSTVMLLLVATAVHLGALWLLARIFQRRVG